LSERAKPATGAVEVCLAFQYSTFRALPCVSVAELFLTKARFITQSISVVSLATG
jgi:hypothetical protein